MANLSLHPVPVWELACGYESSSQSSGQQGFLTFSLCLWKGFLHLLQGSAYYGSLAKLDVPPGFVEKMSLELLSYILTMVALMHGKVEYLWQNFMAPKAHVIYCLVHYRKDVWFLPFPPQICRVFFDSLLLSLSFLEGFICNFPSPKGLTFDFVTTWLLRTWPFVCFIS